jgi:putative ATP-dependent endonuclease of the OLD family
VQVVRLILDRFRSIRTATLYFSGHTLIVGANNIGKSTICEALDLVLGPDRLNRFPPVQEYDFYNAHYLEEDGSSVPASVEVVLVGVSAELERACATHLEFWHVNEKRLLTEGEISAAKPPEVVRCLRLLTTALYNSEDDEFEAATTFAHGTSNFDGSPEKVGRRIKRLFGFLYLRTLRTGSRALSLERGSLLDIIIRLQGTGTALWERSITRLRNLTPPIGDEAAELTPVLRSIEERLGAYIPLLAPGDTTKLFVSQLTRDHLRKTLSFFLSTNADQTPVPFQESGTGTLNTLVLALLSFVADIKAENVIFAMEEPETALPPHTQRRVANYLLAQTAQCFVTSHSPYVIEKFDPEQINILRRDATGAVTTTVVAAAANLKSKHYRRHARRGLAEAMLGRGVIVAEGVTEAAALNATAEKMEAVDPTKWPLDLAGVTVFSVDGDGDMPTFGIFFKTLGLGTYAFYDKKTRRPDEDAKFAASFDIPNETTYNAIERLLIAETPADRQWEFLDALRNSGQQGNLGIPAVRPSPPALADLVYSALKSNKGNGYAASLLDLCEITELPPSITVFLDKVYGDHPKPTPPSVPTSTKPQPPAAPLAGQGGGPPPA